MSENTFNIDVIVQNQNGLKWCPTKSLASSLFHCDLSHSITSSMLCDGFRDCPNELDDMLSMCRPDEPVYIIPILSANATVFCLALFFISCRKQKQPRQELTPVHHSNPLVTGALKDLKYFLANPNNENEEKLEKNIKRMWSLAKCRAIENNLQH